MAIASAVSCSGLIVGLGRFRPAGQEQSRPNGAPLRVELSSCQRFRETVDSRSAGHLRVQTESGPLAAMKEYRQHASHGKGFRSSDEVEHRFSLTSPPGAPTNYAFDGEPQHRRENWVTNICLNSLLDRDNGKNILLRNFLNIDARRLPIRRWFAVDCFRLRATNS